MQDLFGRNTDALKEKRLFMMDMDGTIYNENTLFPGTKPFLKAVEEQGGLCVYMTNNSSKSTEAYLQKLKSMGISATREQFCTSTDVTARYLKEHYPDQLIYCQVTDSCLNELNGAGISTTAQVTQEAAAVLIGNEIDLPAERLYATCEMLTRFPEIGYIATNPDTCCPVHFGYVPDCGSVAKMLEYAVHRLPVFLGKPRPDMLNLLMERYRMPPEKCCAIGDRMYTDIRAGQNAGVDTVCLLSGESTLETVTESEEKPTWVFRDIGEVANALKA